MRLIWTTRWSPYQCPNCSAKFQRQMLPAAILGGIGGGVGTLIFFMALLFQSIWFGVAGLTALFALVIWMDWYLIPFREIEQPKPSA